MSEGSGGMGYQENVVFNEITVRKGILEYTATIQLKVTNLTTSKFIVNCSSKVPIGFSGWKILDALIGLQVPFHINGLSVAVH